MFFKGMHGYPLDGEPSSMEERGLMTAMVVRRVNRDKGDMCREAHRSSRSMVSDET
jgi:hypothetical protein